ncbi:MAG TPA: ABC transporter ATP-binding protein [Tepidisphaeraceae bacterium]|jgi:ABC-2 type transport system ATP-binding protein|nr:ABC transporter ATP-binding protein [Tepidisphaeraceae bacterium]
MVISATAAAGLQTKTIVEISSVSRRFGGKLALDGVSLTIPEGCVLGLVGENGAGKTTLIRHVLGLLRAECGAVRVFGLDPAADPVGVLSRVGYLSEEPELPAWMRIRDLLRYARAFYPAWDDQYADRLRREFGLGEDARIATLSKGQRARAGLLIALAYRPPLLILDEPSSGLDPVVRRDILAAIIRTVADEGRTVLFSSHLLSEVERVCDRVAMIKAGRIVFNGDLADIKQSHHRLTFLFEEPLRTPPRVAGVLSWDGTGREWTALCEAGPEMVEEAARGLGAKVIGEARPSLDEIFFARAGAKAEAEV